MSEPDLIDRYVSELRKAMGSRKDIEDVAAEVEDHLREATERLSSLGRPPHEAQRLIIDRFGQSALVASAFAANSTGGMVMSTAFTRACGAAALVTAGLWCLAATLNWWASELYAPFSDDRWNVVVWVILGALVGTVLVSAGMVVRMGRRDLVPLMAVVGGLGAAAFAATAWMWPIWGLFIGAGFLLILLRWRGSVGARFGDWALVAAWPTGLGVVVALSIAEAGPVDQWGDHPVAVVAGLAVVAALMAVGLVSVGIRMVGDRSARPVRAMVSA